MIKSNRLGFILGLSAAVMAVMAVVVPKKADALAHVQMVDVDPVHYAELPPINTRYLPLGVYVSPGAPVLESVRRVCFNKRKLGDPAATTLKASRESLDRLSNEIGVGSYNLIAGTGSLRIDRWNFGTGILEFVVCDGITDGMYVLS